MSTLYGGSLQEGYGRWVMTDSDEQVSRDISVSRLSDTTLNLATMTVGASPWSSSFVNILLSKSAAVVTYGHDNR